MVHFSLLVKRGSLTLTSLISFLCATIAFAADAPSLKPAPEPTRINFQVEAQEKVAGENMQSTLRLEVKNKLPANAAKELNQRLQESMTILRANKALHVETSQYLTQQLFDDKGRAKDWQVSVELTISSAQWNQLSEHISTLQNKGWLFTGVNFEVSPEQRKAAEKRLTQRALAEWTEQAELIAKQLQLKKWRLGSLQISRHGGMPFPPRPKAYHARLAMAESAPAPDMAGADTTLNIIVNGELLVD